MYPATTFAMLYRSDIVTGLVGKETIAEDHPGNPIEMFVQSIPGANPFTGS